MLRLKLFAVIFCAVVAGLMFLPARTQAFDFFSNSQNPDSACSSSNTSTSSSPVCQEPAQPNNPAVHIIQVTTSIIALLAGLLAVVMIIVSGLTLASSGGNQEAVTNSRKRITSAIVGLIIVALAWSIIRLITDKIIQ